MISTFDIDKIMYGILIDGGVGDVIGGGIYHEGQRPQDSDAEDVVLNHISLTTDTYPQEAVTNVNCFVPDVVLNIGGVEQSMPDTGRLETISDKVMEVVRDARVNGIGLLPTSMAVIDRSEIKQHYVNIRVHWNIQLSTINK